MARPEIDIDPDRRVLAGRLMAEIGILPGALMIPHAELALIVARAFIHGGKSAAADVLGLRSCRVCGCTEHAACVTPGDFGAEPCHWTQADLCSACTPYLEEIR